MSDRRNDRANWRKVALAVGAGLGSLAVCSGAVVVIVLLFIYATEFSIFGSSSASPFFYVGVVTATVFAWASLSLQPLALDARGAHALKTTLLSGLGFCAFVFASFLHLASASFLVPVMSLMALVGTPAIGSLGAILEEGRIAARPLRATLIAGSAIYRASLLASGWFPASGPVSSPEWLWPVSPGIVAMLRLRQYPTF